MEREREACWGCVRASQALLPAPQAGFPKLQQEDCVPLLPVPQTGFPLLNSYCFP